MMLELARRNARDAGADNVELLKGEIESLPLPEARSAGLVDIEVQPTLRVHEDAESAIVRACKAE